MVKVKKENSSTVKGKNGRMLPAETVENTFENQDRASGIQQGEGLSGKQGIDSGI